MQKNTKNNEEVTSATPYKQVRLYRTVVYQRREIMEDVLREPRELSEAELHEIAGGGGGELISVDDVDVNVNVSHNNIDIL
jgi:hypothetical protein